MKTTYVKTAEGRRKVYCKCNLPEIGKKVYVSDLIVGEYTLCAHTTIPYNEEGIGKCKVCNYWPFYFKKRNPKKQLIEFYRGER